MKNIYFVGAPTIAKGIEDFQEIASKCSQAKFTWFSFDVTKEQREKYPNIHFNTKLSDKELKKVILEKMDVFVSCSHFEGFCLPIAEAMLAEKPVIAYRLEEIESEFGSHIEYVACFDKNEMLTKITRQLHAGSNKKNLLNSKRFIKAQYDPERVAERFFSILNEQIDMQQ